MKSLIILSAFLFVGFQAAAEGACYMQRTGQTVSIEQFWDIASQTARQHGRCVTAATSSISVGAYQFDRAGNQLDDYTPPLRGCLELFCDMVR